MVAHKCQVYYQLLKYFRCNRVKMKGLWQECKRHEIPQPSEMTIDMVREGITLCLDELDKLCPVVYPKHKEHLLQQLKTAWIKDKDKNVRAIEQIMLWEDTQNIWGRLKIATCRPRSAAASVCSVFNEDGQCTWLYLELDYLWKQLQRTLIHDIQAPQILPSLRGSWNLTLVF